MTIRTTTVAALLSLAAATGAQAYTLETAHWYAARVPFYLNLDQYNSVAAHELSVWDQYTGNTHLTTTNNAAVNGNVWFMDGRNTIEWSSDVGWDIGSYLGVCSFYSLNAEGDNDGVMREADILLNPNYDWDTGYYDIGRVLLHEMGHAIGLGHSQYGSAVMYQYIFPGSPPELTADDIAGARFLYGTRTEGVPDSGSTAAMLAVALGAVLWLRKVRQ